MAEKTVLVRLTAPYMMYNTGEQCGLVESRAKLLMKQGFAVAVKGAPVVKAPESEPPPAEPAPAFKPKKKKTKKKVSKKRKG